MISVPRVVETSLLDEPGIVQALRVVFAALFASALAVSAVTLFLRWRDTPELALLAAVSSLVALVLSRSGRIRLGILLPLLSITYAVLHAAARDGGIGNIGLALLPVLIVFGGLLLNRLMTVFFTAGVILAVFGMLAVRYFVLRAERYSTNDMGDLFIFAATCAIAALVGHLLAARIVEGFRSVRLSESRYRRMFENVQDVYYEMDTNGILSEVSPASASLFGVPREGMIGRPLASYCIDRSESDALLAATRTHARVSNRELVIGDADAAPRHVLVNAVLHTGLETGEESVIGSIRDITDQKRAEEALHDSEARLRFALDAAGAGTFDFYPQSGKLIWSDITKNHFGMSPETEFDQNRLLNSVHPDDRERVRQAATSFAAQGSEGQVATEYRTIGAEDGIERWIGVCGRMLFDSENRPIRFIGITLDITQRKRLEEQLHRRAEELQKIMDVAPVAVFVANDRECREIIGNRAANFLADTAEGSNFSAMPGAQAAVPWRYLRDGAEVPPEELPMQVAARSGTEVRDYELEVILPSGARRVLWGHATPLHDVAGEIRGAVGAFQDITHSKQRIEAALRESEELFRRVFEEGPLGLALVGMNYRFLKVNNALCQMVGYSEAELLELTFVDITHPDDLLADLAQAERLFSGEVPFYAMRKRYVKKSGEIIWINLTGSIVRNAEGEPTYGIAMIEDITEAKRVQEEALARQKLESVGVLAGGIAHDFNNILGGILAQAELAETELPEDSALREGIQRIEAAAIRGAEIVRELLIYAGKEQHDVAEAVDVSPLVQEIVELLKVSISKHAVLRTDLQDNLPPVWGSAPQIRQVVMNLVINASEAIGDKEGVITVTTNQVSGGRDLAPNNAIELTPGDYVQLEVSDTGSGIANEAKEKIFDPFFTTKFAGRGLGLAVVQGIVRAHRGGINIVSTVGEGTVFRVLLPCARKEDSAVSRAITSDELESPSVRTATILVVEDEELLRRSFLKALLKRGFSVMEAKDGSVALDLIHAHANDIDAVLLDVTLPGISGREVFEKILQTRPELKVIVTSAYDLGSVAASFAELPVHHFIRKPFHLVELVRMLDSILSVETSAPRVPETPHFS